MYFDSINDLDTLKTMFRQLAIKFHPDKNPGQEQEMTVIMQQINVEYEQAMKRILRSGGRSEDQVEEEIELDARIREMIQRIVHLEGIDIELVGSWLWVGGNTFNNRHQLKEAGFLFASKKKAWFWRADEDKARRNRREMSMDDIRNLHGSKTITPERRYALAH